MSFNTQPPEGGWAHSFLTFLAKSVSTHSRLKAAGVISDKPLAPIDVSTHSRLKAAGKVNVTKLACVLFQHTAA